MTIPKGAVWQSLRQRALAAIPIGTVLPYKEPTSLSKWQSTGSYVVTGASSKRFSVIVPSVDLGAALLCESEYFLDHATEQQADIWAQLRANGWGSPAWQVVSFYYWAYYLAMALTRLLGDTVWFVDSEAASRLSKLGPAGSPSPGAGTFRVECGPFVSATERELYLTKASGRVHDQLWKTWARTLDRLLSGIPKGAGDANEERFYLAQQRANHALSPEWPSKLRNLVNYRPGYGYCAVRKTGVLESLRFVESDAPADVSDVISRFEANVLAIRAGFSLEDQPKLAVKALIHLAFLLHATVRELHSELLVRHSVDPRWARDRRSFVQEWCTIPDGGEWPL